MKCDRYFSKRAIILHEHDFNLVYIAGKRIFRCLTCGLLYCERCGKLVLSNKEAKYHSHDKVVEEDSKKVAQNYDINVEEDIPDSPIYRHLQEKIQMVEDERDYYRDQYYQLKEQVKILQQQLLTTIQK